MDKIAIIGGIITSGWVPSGMTVVDQDADQRDRLTAQHGVATTDEVASVAAADIILLAVKPKAIAAVAKPVDADLPGKRSLRIDAGVPITMLADLFDPVAIARTMLWR